MAGNKVQKNAGTTVTFTDQSICPYFTDGRESTIEFLVPEEKDARMFHTYLAKGYRRLGRVYYYNICEGCSECLPLRIETAEFKISRSHKRTLSKNHDINIVILTRPLITPAKVVLYDKYVTSKHGDDKDEPIDSKINVLLNIHYGYPRTIEMNYYLGDTLIGVGIVDEGEDSLSSNYFYYDTDFLDRRPGVFSILKEIELAQRLGKKYYYLGFYIEKNPKMSYKKYFRPNQILDNGKWREL